MTKELEKPATANQATLALLDQWRREDASTDPERIRAAERELAEFQQSMNDGRAAQGERPLYP